MLVNAAELYEKLKVKPVAACLYIEAAETISHIDKADAIKAYRKACALHCDLSRFDIAGRIEKKIGDTCYNSKHWEEAGTDFKIVFQKKILIDTVLTVFHYKRAANFLSGEMLIDQSDLCFAKAAECLVRLSDFEEARYLFESLAASAVRSNLRRFNAKNFLLKAFLCVLAENIEISVEEYKVKSEQQQNMLKSRATLKPVNEEGEDDAEEVEKEKVDYRTNSRRKYDFLFDLCDIDYVKIDFMWRGSIERKFIQNILTAREKCDKHDFIDHVYHYNNIRPIEQIYLKLLKVPMDEIPHELEVKKYMEEERRKAAERQKYLELLASSGSLESALQEEEQQQQRATMSMSNSEGRSSGESFQPQQDSPQRTSIHSDGGRASMSNSDGGIRPSVGFK